MAVIRDMMPAFQLFQPASTDDALGLLEQYGSEVLGVGRGPQHVGLAQGPGEAAGGHGGRGGGTRRFERPTHPRSPFAMTPSMPRGTPPSN